MSGTFTVIHISDLHFHRIPHRPMQWLSKRSLGAVNMMLNRRRFYPIERAQRLVSQLDGMDWEHLVITGDISQLALEEEFALAHDILRPLLERGPEHVTIIPGNHDRYVHESPGYHGFDAYFGKFFGRSGIASRRLTETWHLAGWDSAIPAPFFKAWGEVGEETLKETEQWLKALPQGAKVILANHYPLYFPSPFQFEPSHDLRDFERVRDWVGARPIDIYLHGHHHFNWLLRTENDGRECTHINSASTTRLRQKGEKSDFHRIIISGADFEVHPLSLE